jgi:hypothetical protein
MRDTELLAEWVHDLARDVRREIGKMSRTDLHWQADSEANSIGITVWHIARTLDLLDTRVMHNRPQEDEQWFTRGWCEKTRYDPRGIGYRGFGAITGYTLDELKHIPVMSVDDLLTYLDQVCSTLATSLIAVSTEALHQTAPLFNGERTVYEWIKPILKGSIGHVGEIQTLKAMQKRKARAAERE